jgi:hypothetical protein
MPNKKLFHEVAHVVLGHSEEFGQQVDGEVTPRNLREVEAEAIALIFCDPPGLQGSRMRSRDFRPGGIHYFALRDKRRLASIAFRLFSTLPGCGKMPESIHLQAQ